MKIIPKISLIAILVLVAIFFINASFQVLIPSNEKENESEPPISEEENTLPNESRLLGIGENERFDPDTSIYHHSHDPSKMYDDFSNWPPWKDNGDGALSPNEKWTIAFKGGGAIGVMQDYDNSSNDVMVLEPKFVQNETRAPLLLTTDKYTDFIVSLDVRTDEQLRSNPNTWEMGWILWRYIDETHFNYFVLKSNGTECGKYDGGINPIDQLFICDSEFPTTYPGKWDHLDIIVKGDHITILVNGKIVQDFDDISSFDTGSIGLYNEDARTSFDNITIIPI